MRITAFEIIYETDGYSVDLPESLSFEVDKDFNAQIELADKVSDYTGFLVKSLEYKLS